MTACLAHIEGETATLTGVDREGRPFLVEIPFFGVLALNQQCAVALMGLERARQGRDVTTDDPWPDLVGREGE